jgi:hypothetical protein
MTDVVSTKKKEKEPHTVELLQNDGDFQVVGFNEEDLVSQVRTDE